ncbi:hypothetical protein M406DRAFT_335251 [Cryphonectria parasitica EP155]|uniref:Uncharacterized protein n=1 Tax=Cryphonectria parasitica (strain ATCC 38755 / EP155) TaxID=660469 RepID=A0A9P5CJS8_CRYP1|nr:uncharacterized protein M406DRAFT_335251 [Cryphonectria parasitica EP155]KAF3760040.1 hypothetical protein M406DRAFT_335251 [Cryphonectria parasitica EP155]
MPTDFVDLLLRLEDHDIIPSCLSAERHKPRDFLLHYLGCEQFFQREEYLASLSANQARQVHAKLQRIQYLRNAMFNDIGEGRSLVQNLTSSLERWRDTKDFQEGIDRVRELRTLHFATNGMAQKDVRISTRGGEYNPDIDTNAYMVRFRNGRLVHDTMDSRFQEQFPAHRVSVQDLIYGREDESPLNAPEETINYFHFPANNMFRAITRYLRNKPTSPRPSQSNEVLEESPAGINRDRKISTADVRSCLYGCRHKKVPSEGQDGIALFMPYLHWDTARHQGKISQAVYKETERQRKEKLQQERQLAGMRRVRHRGLQLLNAQSRQPNTAWRLENRTVSGRPDIKPTTTRPATPPRRTATGVFANIMKRHGRFRKVPLWSVFTTDDQNRVVAGSELGQVLFDAAMLYEAMSTYREKALIQKYLHEDPPLHPRRTLEQTNEWTLSLSWHASARDQVVHRATRPKQLDFHSVDPFTKEWRDRVRKIPRVMMIDQLWMWILDDRTIITCFPDQGDVTGSNNGPGIHKNIRDAFIKTGKGQNKTVFDVALVILGEALISRASLYAVKANMEINLDSIFSHKMVRLEFCQYSEKPFEMYKHSFGAEQYWEWARIFSRLAHTDVDNGLSDLIVPFLDIGKEGELQGQIKSIVRDLEIMLRISIEQKEVVEKFEKTMLQLARGRPTPDVDPLLMEIHSNVEDLEDMRRSANDISASVTVVQAWQSMKQGEDTQRQNVTLLVFTVVTVIFLPMSFISSVFGMNNKEIAGPEAPMTLSEQFKWMIPMSFGIVAITYYTAFGSPARMSRDLFRWVYIKCGMYRLFAPADLTIRGLRDQYMDRSKKKEKEQEWVRRRSEQMARDAHERRQATRRAAIIDDTSISPDTPTVTPALPTPHSHQQTGMLAVYQDLNTTGSKRSRIADIV